MWTLAARFLLLSCAVAPKAAYFMVGGNFVTLCPMDYMAQFVQIFDYKLI